MSTYGNEKQRGLMRIRGEMPRQDILGLQAGKYISGSHCSQTAHPGKATTVQVAPTRQQGSMSGIKKIS